MQTREFTDYIARQRQHSYWLRLSIIAFSFTLLALVSTPMMIFRTSTPHEIGSTIIVPIFINMVYLSCINYRRGKKILSN